MDKNTSPAILVIEDNPAHLKALSDILDTEDFHPIGCRSGAEALLACRRHDVHVAILDLRLPDMDGLDLLTRLKQEHPDMKIIINTGHATMESAMAAVNRDAFAFVEKMGDMKALLRHVHRAFHAHFSMHSARLESDVRKRTAELNAVYLQVGKKATVTEALYNGTRLILEDKGFEITAGNLFDICRETIGGRAGYVALLSDDGKDNEVVFIEPGGLACNVGANSSMPIRGLREAACRSGKTVYENEFRHGKWIKHLPKGHIALENVLFAPMIFDGKTVGLIGIANKPDGFTDDDAKVARAFGELTAIALNNSLAKKALKEKESQIRQTQRLEAIGALAGGIAHDFNNILSPILGFAEILRDDLPEGSAMQDSVDRIFNSTLRARDLVKQILAFSRQAEKEIRPLKPDLILNEILKLIRSTIPTTIEIKRKIDTDCGLIIADPIHIHQIAMNLFTNAYHAMQDTGGTLAITLQKKDITESSVLYPRLFIGPWVCMTVSDTGIGMDAGTMEKIFDPYFSTKPKDKGTGLGLSVVHGIVNTYQGDILVNSTPGQGSEFNVFLPVAAPGARAITNPEIMGVEKGNEHVLVVDDDEEIVRLQKEILERFGYSVETQPGGREALAAFENAPDAYDVVITDMTMPGLTGDRLAGKIMKIRPGIPIIICTGFSERISPEKTEKMGISGFLMKPVVTSELANMVRNVLDSRIRN